MSDISTNSTAKPTPSMLTESDHYDIDLRELFAVLKRRRNIILGTIALALLLAVLFLMLATPRYTGTTLLQVSKGAHVVDFQSVVSGISGDEAAIQSELDILNSPDLAGRVVDAMGLVNDKEFGISPSLFTRLFGGKAEEEHPDADELEEQQERRQKTITNVLHNLNVTRNPRSYTLVLSFNSTSPEKAASIANSYAEEYLLNQLQSKFDETKRANQWLTEKLGALQKKLRQSELAVEAYRQQHNLLKADTGVTLTDKQLSDLNTQLILARAELAQAKARMQGSDGDIHSSSEVLNSPLIQSLKEQEAQVMRKRSDLSNRYGPRHPKMVNVNAELRDIRSKIQAETSKIKSSLSNEVEIARSKEKALEKSLKQLEGKAGSSNKASVQLDQLIRERDANKALYESFLNRFKETSQNQDLQQADARIISKASIPLKASFPKKALTLLVAFILGSGLGVVLAFLTEQLDNAFKSTEQLEKMTATPAIGMVPELPGKTDIIEYTSTKLSSIYAESLRSVLTSLHFSNPDHPPKVIMVTSTTPQEGKSSFSASLATLQAKSGMKVLLVDCDMKRPSISKVLGAQKIEKGLGEFLTGDASEKDVVRLDKRSGLHFISSSPNTVYSQDILNSQKMSDFLAHAAKKYDMVILDTPPVMAVSDALVLSSKVDAVLFMVRWDKTPRPLVKAAIKQLHSSHAKMAGTVLSRVNLEKHSRYGYADRGAYYGQYKEYYTQ